MKKIFRLSQKPMEKSLGKFDSADLFNRLNDDMEKIVVDSRHRGVLWIVIPMLPL